MKNLIFLSTLILITACSTPSIEKDGGTRITLEASVADLLKESMKADDSLANVFVYETQKDFSAQEKSFIDLYFTKLEQASGSIPAGKHFDVAGLSPTANATACKAYFEKSLTEKMDANVIILAKRIDEFGVAGAKVSKGAKPEQLLVEVPGKVNAQRLRQLLQSTAKLEFWETYENEKMYEQFAKLNTILASGNKLNSPDTVVAEEVKAKSGTSLNEQLDAIKSEKEIQEEAMKKAKAENPVFVLLTPAIVYDGSGHPSGLAKGPVVGYSKISDTAKINSMLNSKNAKSVFGRYTKFLWTFKPMDAEQKIVQLIAIRTSRDGSTSLSGNIITDARKMFDDSGIGQVSMTMTKEAGWEWKNMTKNNIGNAIAIVVDDLVYSYPVVMSEIPGGVSSISGNFTMEELDDLVNIMKAGYLPISLHIIQEDVVPPLGK